MRTHIHGHIVGSGVPAGFPGHIRVQHPAIDPKIFKSNIPHSMGGIVARYSME